MINIFKSLKQKVSSSANQVCTFCLSGLIAIVLIFSCTMNVFALSYDGSSSGANNSSSHSVSGGYSLPYAKSSTDELVGYRFTGVLANGTRTTEECLDIILTNSKVYKNLIKSSSTKWGWNYFYISRDKYSKLDIYNAVLADESLPISTHRGPYGPNTILSTDPSLDGVSFSSLTDPANLEAWQSIDDNIEPIARLVGYPYGISSMAKDDKIIVEPIFAVTLDNEANFMTLSELAYYGRWWFMANDGLSITEAGNTMKRSGGFGYVMRFTNGYWPNLLYTTDKNGLFPQATYISPNPKTGIPDSPYRATLIELLTKGYGVAVMYSAAEDGVAAKTYTVTWKNWDGKVLETDKDVAFGTMPTYNGSTPTRTPTAQYSYLFTDWTPSISPVTGDVTYTATYKATTRTYTVTWKNWDGTVLETDTGIAFGATPIYNGKMPTKASTAQYSYGFAGWTPSISPVTDDVTYTATYKATTRTYTVTWKNWDGKVLEIDSGVAYGTTPTYNSKTPTRATTAQYTFSHNGWTPSISPVTGDVTYTATFKETTRKYTVTWKNWDGKVLETDKGVAYGTMPTYNGKTPTKASTAQYSYSHNGWTPTVSAVTGDVTYTATFKETSHTYTVTWKNWDGKVLETDTGVTYGTTPTYNGSTPTRTSTAQYSYSFTGWTPKISPVTGDVTYTATYKAATRTYTVTWKNWDGKVLEIDSGVAYGTTPTYNGSTPTRATTAQYTYSHNGWTPKISAVTGDVTYTATFKETIRKYTVTWKNWDGKVLETDTGVAYGTMPTYNGKTPTKASTAQYTYSHNGWTPSISPVTGDVTYTATFKEAIRKYTVTWKNWDGKVLETDTGVAYGTMPTYNGFTPTRATTAQYTYRYNGWTPTISPVTGDVTYTATFKETIRKYTVTWKNWDGIVLEIDTDVAYGTTPTYNGKTPTKASTTQCTYSHNGWTPKISPVTGNVTYTATFKVIPVTYKITYDANGGNLSGSKTQTYNFETNVTLQAAPSRSGYVFTGWKLSTANGNWSAATYNAGQNIGTGKYGDVTLVAQWDLILSIEAIEPNSSYRDGVEVISSFMVNNHSTSDLLPSRNVSVQMKVYKGGILRYTATKSAVVVPKENTNLVYFKWTVPAGLGSGDWTVFGELLVNGTRVAIDSMTVASGTVANHQTPVTSYETSQPNDWTMVNPPSAANPTASWYEWVYTNNTFVKKSYSVKVATPADDIIVPDSRISSAKKISGYWHIKSGYGFTLNWTPTLQSVGTHSATADMFTIPQTAYALFPEFKYSSIGNGTCRLLENVNGTLFFVKNTAQGQGRRLHFIPIWYPGTASAIKDYTVSIKSYDCWTPAGMITTYMNTNTFKINGSMYDDYFVGQ